MQRDKVLSRGELTKYSRYKLDKNWKENAEKAQEGKIWSCPNT